MSHESLTSNPVDIKRTIETLPGRFGFAEESIARFDLSKAYYLIEQGGSNQITARFYDTHGDLIAGFVNVIVEPISHDCEPINSADDSITRYCKSLAVDAIIDDEFGRRLHDAELVIAIMGEYGITRAEWDAKPEIEKRLDQIAFVAPPFCMY
jgi:hypothetical protein